MLETSLTIPDVTFVVDSGRVKELSYDAELALTSATVTPRG
jgi:HrpA-like RNA helicase